MTNYVSQQNKKIAVYARVSSTKQENEGTIETQLAAVRTFAAQNGYTIVQEYLDNGWSGDNIIRPELDKLRVDAKRNIWEIVLIYDPDRLARRYSYQELIIDELKESGIVVLFVTTPAPTNSIEKILYGVQGLFAEYERAKITERFRLGKLRKATEGHIQVSEAPYGYTYILKKGKKGDVDFQEGHYEINTLEAFTLKQIFSWVGNDGMTIRKVIKQLYENNIPPRRSKKGAWSNSTLCGILRNKTYIGEAHFGASYSVVPKNPNNKEIYKKVRKSSKALRPESEWIKIQTPAIIDKELFEKAQKQLKQNAYLSKRNTKYEYLLSGKIRCTCGSMRSAESLRRGGALCYRCSSRFKHYPAPTTCIEKSIRADATDNIGWDAITTLMSSEKLLQQQLKRFIQNKTTAKSIVNTEAINKEIQKLKEQQKRYTKAYAEGLLAMEQLKEYIAPVEASISALQLQIDTTAKQEQDKYLLPTENDIKAFTQKAKQVLQKLDFTIKKDIVKNVIDTVVGNKERLIISGYIPVTNSVLCSHGRDNTNTISIKKCLQSIAQNATTFSIPFEITVDMKQKKILKKAA